jgi:hypothetical protein
VQRLLDRDSRIVECDVQAAELAHGKLDEALHVGLYPHIRTEVAGRSSGSTNPTLDLSSECLATPAKGHVGAFASKSDGRRAADARCAAGNHHHFVGEALTRGHRAGSGRHLVGSDTDSRGYPRNANYGSACTTDQGHTTGHRSPAGRRRSPCFVGFVHFSTTVVVRLGSSGADDAENLGADQLG